MTLVRNSTSLCCGVGTHRVWSKIILSLVRTNPHIDELHQRWASFLACFHRHSSTKDTDMKRGVLFFSAIAASLSLATQSFSALSQEQPPSSPSIYWVSMRGIATESAPSFAIVVPVADATRSMPIAGCDARTYYASATDGTAIASARAAGEVVQLHRGEPGSTPESSSIMCVIDGSGGT